MTTRRRAQTEGITVRAIDHVASMVAYWLKASKGMANRSELQAKCWGLLDAYKQTPLSDQSYESGAFLTVYSPKSGAGEVFASVSYRSVQYLQ